MKKLSTYKINFYENLHFIWADVVNRLPNFYRPLPPVVIFILSFKCNLKCGMCPVHKKKYHDEISFAQYKKILRNVQQSYAYYPYKPIIWFTGGEIFLVKDLEKILDYTNRLGFRYGFLSNGSIFSRRINSRILSHNVIELRFSLDGSKEIHDSLRGVNGVYDQVNKNISFFINSKSKFPVKINSVISPDLNNIFELLKISSKYGVDINMQHILFIKKGKLQKFDYFFSNMQKYINKKNFQINVQENFSEEKIINFWQTMKLLENYHPNFNLFIYPELKSKQDFLDYYQSDASISFSSKNKSISSIAKIFPDCTVCGGGHADKSNLLSTPFHEIWNNKIIRNYRKDVASYKKIPKIFPVSCH